MFHCRQWPVLGAFLALLACYPAGAEESANKQPGRIVSLVPSFTETLFAVGAGEAVVGVSAYCKFPEAATRLPNAGGYHDPNYEAILALQPDLVLLSGFREETAELLSRYNITVRSFRHGTLEEVLDSIRGVGEAAGHPEEAQKIVSEIEAQIDKARKASEGKPRERVLLVVGRDISDTALREVYAAGPKGFLNDLLLAAGAENALTDAGVEYPILTAEGIIALKPDRIFEIFESPGDAEELREKCMATWRKLPHRDFAGEGRVHLFTRGYMNIPGPRIGNILDDFVAALQSDPAGDSTP